MVKPAHLGLQWEYEIQWYDGGERDLENVVVVESRPRDLGSFGLIDLEMWTNTEDVNDRVTNLQPLKMFVQVTRGSSPVLGAKVRVQVKITDFNGGEEFLEPIELYDNGNGG